MSPVRPSLLVASFLVAAGPALAHTGGELGGLTSGLLHPVTGLDHVVAMVAVGLWGGILGAPAIWLLPIVFPLVMALGGAAGVAGVPLPGIEAGIALSGVVLGLMVVLAVRPPLWVAVALVGVFAVFHGHAHGAELPQSAIPAIYAVGFVTATGLLHLAGIGFGQVGKWRIGRVAVRVSGAAIALTGGAFLAGVA
jgi:urease accessory protein